MFLFRETYSVIPYVFILHVVVTFLASMLVAGNATVNQCITTDDYQAEELVSCVCCEILTQFYLFWNFANVQL